MAFLLILVPVVTVGAASSLKLYYDKKNVTYTDKQVKYVINGKTISKAKYPGIIISGTSLAPAKDIFTNKLIGGKYSYSSKTGKITIKKDYTTVVMTIGSTKATVDGKSYTMSIAPRTVKFGSTGVTKVMVPARFVFESLGYSYNYTSSNATATVKAPTVKPLNLYYDKKWSTYLGTQGKVTVDGEAVSVTSMPSIILDKTTLVQAKKVFTSAGIDAEYQYNKDKKQVILTKDDTIVLLTVDSKTATVNGKNKTMGTAVKIIKNKSNGNSYVMVPGSDVAGYLGFNYSWNSSTATSVITSKPVITEPEEPEVPETPDETQNNYLSFNLVEPFLAEFNGIAKITHSDLSSSASNINQILSIENDGTEYKNREVYKITADQPFSLVRSSYADDKTISLEVNKTVISEQTLYMGKNLVNTVNVGYNSGEYKANIKFDLNTAKASYETSLSEDKKTIFVIVYNNYIETIDLSHNNSTDSVTIKSLYNSNATVSDDGDHIYIDIPNTVNSIGEQNEIISNGYCISSIQVVENGKNVRITIGKTENSEYEYVVKDNSITVTLTGDNQENNNNLDYSLKIEKPSDVTFNNIKHEDLYYKKQFKIILPGDYVSFYEENPIKVTNSIITNVQVSLKNNGNTEILVTTNKLQGYKLINNGEDFTVLVDDPTAIYKNIVVLDAGHGGTDTGAIANKVNEKDLNYTILNEYAAKYFNASNSEVKAYWVRYNDTKIDLYERAAFAKSVGADLFVSLHMNSATATASGTEVFYSSVNKSEMNGLTGYKLAKLICDNLTSSLDMKNRGAKDSKFVVCKSNTVPAVLIELGFISNKSDFEKLTDPEFQDEAASVIYNSVCQAFALYPTGR